MDTQALSQVLKTLEASLQRTAVEFQTLNGTMPRVTALLSSVNTELAAFKVALQNAAPKPQPPPLPPGYAPAPGSDQALRASFARLEVAAVSASVHLNYFAQALAAATAVANSGRPSSPPAEKGDSGVNVVSTASAPDAMGRVGNLFASLNTVGQTVVSAFQSITAQAAGFVEALNPSALLVFGQAMRDLQATIGVALQPVIDGATIVVRQFADALLPVMQQLEPVVASLTTAFIDLAGPIINAFATAMEALLPVVKILADAFGALVPWMQGAVALWSGVSSALAGVFKSLTGGLDMKSVTDSLKSAMQTLASYTLQAAAYLAKFADSLLGTSMLKDFVDGAKKALIGPENKMSATGMAAAKDVVMGDLRAFGNSITTAAFNAGQGGGDLSPDQTWQRDVIKQLEAIKEGKGSALEHAMNRLTNKVEEFGNKVVAAVKGAIYDPPAEFAKEVWKNIDWRDAVDPAGVFR